MVTFPIRTDLCRQLGLDDPLTESYTAAWVRSASCNFPRILETCDFTVFSLTNNAVAISVFDIPVAIRRKTSNSRFAIGVR